MRYQALHPITESLRDGSVRVHPVGSFLHDFEKWGGNAQSALIASEWVAEVPDGAADAIVVAPAAPTAAHDLPCGECDRFFSTKRSLAMHVTKTHRRG